MRREWIEITRRTLKKSTRRWSPSMRREWIEIVPEQFPVDHGDVSLHAEGVD